MTETWACTDCPAEVDVDKRQEHMKDEHGARHGEIGPPTAGLCRGCGVEILGADRETFARVVKAHEKAHGHVDQAAIFHPSTCPDCRPGRPCARATALEGR